MVRLFVVRPLLTRVRMPRGLIWSAALLFLATQTAGELHLHADVPEEFCTVCGFAESGATAGRADLVVHAPAWTAAGTLPRAPGHLASPPFDAERSRAPPLS